jgi:hypothetical protein
MAIVEVVLLQEVANGDADKLGRPRVLRDC